MSTDEKLSVTIEQDQPLQQGVKSDHYLAKETLDKNDEVDIISCGEDKNNEENNVINYNNKKGAVTDILFIENEAFESDGTFSSDVSDDEASGNDDNDVEVNKVANDMRVLELTEELPRSIFFDIKDKLYFLYNNLMNENVKEKVEPHLVRDVRTGIQRLELRYWIDYNAFALVITEGKGDELYGEYVHWVFDHQNRQYNPADMIETLLSINRGKTVYRIPNPLPTSSLERLKKIALHFPDFSSLLHDDDGKFLISDVKSLFIRIKAKHYYTHDLKGVILYPDGGDNNNFFYLQQKLGGGYKGVRIFEEKDDHKILVYPAYLSKDGEMITKQSPLTIYSDINEAFSNIVE